MARGDAELTDDPARLIRAQPEGDPDASMTDLTLEWDICVKVQVGGVFGNCGQNPHFLDYPSEVSPVRSCVEGHTGLVRHIVLLSGASACQ